MPPLDSVADVETPNEALVFWICEAVNCDKNVGINLHLVWQFLTVVTYVCGVHHAIVGGACAFHLAIHGVDLAQTRGFVWNGGADLTVGV